MFILILIILSFLREPLFFVNPRVYAEDGSLYIQSVYENGPLKNLFQPIINYYSFFPNFISSFGLYFFGLFNMAYVLSYSSYLIILLTVTGPMYLPSKYWEKPWKKIILSLFSLLIGSGEIWMFAAGTQFYFCLFGAFLLLSKLEELRGFTFFLVISIFLLGATSGPPIAILAPFFIWKYFCESKKTLIDKTILLLSLFGLIVQIISVIYFSLNYNTTRVDYKNIINFPEGLFGNSTGIIAVGDYLRWSYCFKFLEIFSKLGKEGGCLAWGVIRLFFLAPLILLMIFSKKIFLNFKILILTSYLAFFFTLFSIGMKWGPRYSFVPAVLLFIFLINIFSKDRKIFNFFLSINIVILFFLAITKYFDMTNYYNSDWTTFSINNLSINDNNDIIIKIFPQYSKNDGIAYDWVIKITNDQYLKFK